MWLACLRASATWAMAKLLPDEVRQPHMQISQSGSYAKSGAVLAIINNCVISTCKPDEVLSIPLIPKQAVVWILFKPRYAPLVCRLYVVIRAIYQHIAPLRTALRSAPANSGIPRG